MIGPNQANSILARARRCRSILALAGCAAAISACQSATRLSQTPVILANAVVDPFKWVAEEQKTNKVDVFYATDRQPGETLNGRPTYTYKRSKSLAFGSCVVEIGKNLPWKELIEQSETLRRTLSLPLSIQSVEEQGRFPETPLKVVDGGIDDPQDVAAQAEAVEKIHREMARRLAQTPQKVAYVLVHGYNNSFDDAAFVMAEVWHFLGRGGVPVVYTWPAGIGGLRGYTYDRESGEFTNYHLKQFLKALATCPGLEKIQIISHSRGTDVITTALRELFIESRAAGRDPRTEYKIENLVLAAPDMDFDVVVQRGNAERIFFGVGRLTIYVSKYDRALGFSDWFFQGVRRLGQLGHDDLSDQMRANMAKIDRVDVINVTARTDFMGHGYFHTNPNVSADLVLLLRDNLDAGAAHGRPLQEVAPHFWALPPGYPQTPK